jgi:DNA-damage-inducible protein J
VPANAVVRARIDESVKEEAAAVLAAMGLSLSDAIRLMLIRVARERTFPFEPLQPNEVTIQAMRDARVGKTVKHKSIDLMMVNLHSDN